MANRFGGCFVWALAPFCVLFLLFAVCFAVSAGEMQVWLGDLRVVVFGWLLCFFVCCFNRFAASMDFICPCTNVFPAYSHVRTEPLVRHRPHSKKTQRTLEDTHASLQQTELLAGAINEQDCRAVRSLLLPKESAHPCRGPSQCHRT